MIKINKKRRKYAKDIFKILRKKYFLDPNGNNTNEVSKLVNAAVKALVAKQGKTPNYPVISGIPSISQLIDTAEIPLKLCVNPNTYLRKLPTLVQGSVKSGHPFMVKNLIPTASLPALATYIAVSPYMPNAVTGEDAAQVLLAELACSSAISKLVGIDHQKSAGVFTFGGTGTNLYAIKMGLFKVDPDHGLKGIRENIAVIESAPAHYCHKTAANWLGIGQNNSLRVASNPDQTTKLDELKNKCIEAIEQKRKIACINCLGGTTSNMGIDDIKEIFKIREFLVDKYRLDYKPHIHVDSVLGWAYLNFVNYNFQVNPLRFKTKTLLQIQKILKRVKTFKYADSFGVDFHKTGYVAYNSSMIIVKDRHDLMRLQRDMSIMTPLFHDDEAYNPGKFTLETSRSAANILATWIALQTFGQEGYQALLGHAIEMGIKFREGIEQNIDKGLYIANQEQFGPDVFIRCYAPGIIPQKEYLLEMRDDIALKRNTEYTSQFFKWLNKNMSHSEKGFAVSKSSAAIYTHTGAPMVALRIYPLSPYITEKTADELISRLVSSKQKFDLSYAEKK